MNKLNNKTVRVYAPGTVANVCCGFDVLGFCLSNPGDILEMSLNNTGKIDFINLSGEDIPVALEKNVAYAAIKPMIDELDIKHGITVSFIDKIHPGSGIGSSSASAVAAVFALNELMGKPFSKMDLIRFAVQGEALASGEVHADNIAPAMLGGFTLVRSTTPLDIINTKYPEDLWYAVVLPDLVVKTKESREILPKNIPLKLAVEQWSNVAGLIAGLYANDTDLISRSLNDVIAEPYRKNNIPDFDILKHSAIKSGALGCGISGSGPSLFALCKNESSAEKVSTEMKAHFSDRGISSDVFFAKIDTTGVRKIDNK